ncbi:hypothetical protein DFJ74DRAFT_131533 [Hyaloraphidium curvatum]|nr:hypothetical protein DFJ74DRAFT_131533 [Hyaloraphidium curvatum]
MSVKRYFEHTTKFWEISLEEGSSDTTVRFGKLGTNGQTRDKSHASSEEAAKFVEKMVKEKLKEGYVEAGVAAGDTEEGASGEPVAEQKAPVDVEEPAAEEEKPAKRTRGKAAAAAAEPAPKKARATRAKKAKAESDAEPEGGDAGDTKHTNEEAAGGSDALSALLDKFDFSDLGDGRKALISAFADGQASAYWDEGEKYIFKPEPKAWSFGVAYNPAQFGWLRELQAKRKAGEDVALPDGVSPADLEGLQKDLEYLADVSTKTTTCTVSMGSEGEYPFLPVVVETPSLEPKDVFAAMGINPEAANPVHKDRLGSDDAVKEWFETRILCRESYDEGAQEFEDKKKEYAGMWDAVERLKERGLASAICGEMRCNPCPVLILGWSDREGTAEKPARAIGFFGGVVYT